MSGVRYDTHSVSSTHNTRNIMSKQDDSERQRESISVTVSKETLERLEEMPAINRSRFMEEATIDKMEELGY